MTADQILEKAHERCHLVPAQAGSYREGLERLLEAMVRDSSMTQVFGNNLTELLIANLVARLKVDDYIAANPHVRQEIIRKPIFVFGLPRTGTTLLSQLLATDPSHRSLRNWEAAEPVPPATQETLLSDPRCIRKRITQELILALDPRMARVHWEFADEPTECDSLLSQDFKSAHWAILLPEYGEWLRECDMSSAYAYHKSVLQVLQSASHGKWNLKSTCHGLFLEVLKREYPDARLVWIHRDPFKALASTCSLVRAQQTVLGAEIHSDLIRQTCQTYLTVLLEHLLAAKQQLPGDAIYHLWYSRLLQSPIAETQELYRWLGDDWTPRVESGMRSWLNTHPQGKYGKHQYSLEEFGICESGLPGIFRDYLIDFRIERESASM